MNTVNHKNDLSRREREKLAHRNEIIDAAIRVFAQKGFFYATLDEVAQEAEFSKSTLYLYFENKEDLLYNIIMEKTAAFTQILQETLSGTSGFKQELTALFVRFAEVSFSEKDLLSLIMAQHAANFKALSPINAKELHSAHGAFYDIIQKRVTSACGKDELRKLDPRTITGLIHGSLEHMMITRWNYESPEQLKQGVETYIDIIFNGIANEKETS